MKTFPSCIESDMSLNGSIVTDNEIWELQASCTSESSCSLVSQTELSPVGKHLENQSKNSDDLEILFTPQGEQIDAISEFLTNLEKEWAVRDRISCNRVESDLNRLFKYHFEGNTVTLYGSYYSDIAITTSNKNIALQSDANVRNSFMYQVYKVLNKELDSESYHVLPFEDLESKKKSKILFSDASGVICELAYLGKNEKNIFQLCDLLKNICSCNPVVKSLITVVRIWAEITEINETEAGKLHPVGFTILAIHFLQQYKKCGAPLLPVIDKEVHWKFMEPVPRIDVSVGDLWLEFLKYYGFTFNWVTHIVTITDIKFVSKSSKSWEHFWIAIEDPFSGKNIAETVLNSDVAQYIQSLFKSHYKYFSHPQVVEFENDTSDNSCGTRKLKCKKWNFSFNSCEIEDSSIFCEECDEDYTCEKCRSKCYQPVATCTENFPDVPDTFLKVIDDTLLKIYDENKLAKAMVEKRVKFVDFLESYVQFILPGAKLQLFGSSVNGFGFNSSDLDICLTISGKSLKEINTSQILWKLRCHLRRNRKFANVYALFAAQIPILKFSYTPEKWQGDISLYNSLAVHNSNLLCHYSLIDDRCKILGCALKLLAKYACIADSAEKTLSSYSYIIMVIHYLQQTEPPVLPILQDFELSQRNLEIAVKVVDDWNVWFCENIQNEELWNEEERNSESAGKLFVGLLDYYVRFNNNRVITIRQKEPMYTSEKGKIARLFNIEDPFILTRNLGCVLSDKKAQETLNAFRRARQLFGKPVDAIPTGMQDFKDFFFSTRNLTGQYTLECKLCGNVGHDKSKCTIFKSKPVTRKLYPHKQNSLAGSKKHQIYKI